jgi:hypothetical protein
LLQKPQSGATPLVDAFDAARIISKKRSIGGKDRRIEGEPAGSYEDRSAFEDVKLFR